MISVIFTVYSGSNLRLLQRALVSIINQSYQDFDIIVIFDGIEDDSKFERVVRNTIETSTLDYKIIKLEFNKGPGYARDIGIKQSNRKYIAIMDSDDVSLPNRLKIQFEHLSSNPGISCCGGGIIEKDSTLGTSRERKVPLEHEEIVSFSKTKSPLNNVTAMFLKSDYIVVGGYPHLRSSEDYSLWTRFIGHNKLLSNIPIPLVEVDFDISAVARRTGMLHFKNDSYSQRELLKYKIITKSQFIRNLLIYGVFRFSPSRLKTFAYKHILR